MEQLGLIHLKRISLKNKGKKSTVTKATDTCSTQRAMFEELTHRPGTPLLHFPESFNVLKPDSKSRNFKSTCNPSGVKTKTGSSERCWESTAVISWAIRNGKSKIQNSYEGRQITNQLIRNIWSSGYTTPDQHCWTWVWPPNLITFRESLTEIS